MKKAIIFKITVFGLVLLLGVAVFVMLPSEPKKDTVSVSSVSETSSVLESSRADVSVPDESSEPVSEPVSEPDNADEMGARAVAEIAKTAEAMPETDLSAELADIKRYNNIYSIIQKESVYPVCRAEGVCYFGDTTEGFEKMIEDMESAEKYIFLEYFILNDGDMWKRVERILAEKAEQGVTVRVLVDGLQGSVQMSSDVRKRLEGMGAELRLFSDVTDKDTKLATIRDHRKIAVIDGKAAYTGGSNLSDEYINLTSPYGEWKDTYIRVGGDAAKSFALMFMQVWNISGEIDELPDVSGESADSGAEGYVVAFSDSPFDDVRTGRSVFIALLRSAKKRVDIMTPYFVPDDGLLEEVKNCAGRGVSVRLFTPAVSDGEVIMRATRSYYEELIEAGVRVYEFSPGFLHSKVLVADNDLAYVGSANMERRSFLYNFECGVCLLGCKEGVSQIEADFEETIGRCKEYTAENVSEFGITDADRAFLRTIASQL